MVNALAIVKGSIAFGTITGYPTAAERAFFASSAICSVIRPVIESRLRRDGAVLAHALGHIPHDFSNTVECVEGPAVKN